MSSAVYLMLPREGTSINPKAYWQEGELNFNVSSAHVASKKHSKDLLRLGKSQKKKVIDLIEGNCIQLELIAQVKQSHRQMALKSLSNKFLKLKTMISWIFS